MKATAKKKARKRSDDERKRLRERRQAKRKRARREAGKSAKKKAKKRPRKRKRAPKGGFLVDPLNTKGPRVFSYRAKEPIENLDGILEQMRLGRHYRNALCEIELERRRQVDEALEALSPGLRACEEKLAELDEQIETLRAEARARRVLRRDRKPDPEIQKQIRELRKVRKPYYEQRTVLRKQAFESEAWEQDEERINEWVSETTAEKRLDMVDEGLYFGTYLQVEKAAGLFRRGAPPKFVGYHNPRAWRLCAVQIQEGMTVRELLACTSRWCRLELRPEGVWVPGTHRDRKLGTAILWIRVGSEGRDPVWAKIPFYYERELPEDAIVKWAWALKTRVGTKTRWRVQITLERGSWARPERATDGSVAIDVGWRHFPGAGLRVGVAAATDGREFEVRLPEWWLQENERVRRIEGHRDKGFNSARDRAAAKIRQLGDAAPEWVREACKGMKKWRAPARLAGLSLRWRSELEDAGEPIPDLVRQLEDWRKRDKHLLEYEAHLRTQLQASRRNFYRTLANDLSKRYGAVVREDLDLREFHKTKAPEKGATHKDDALRRYIREACISELFEALAGRMDVVRVNPARTTLDCHACGGAVDAADPAAVVAACASCGTKSDQDVRAARNLLATSGVTVSWTRDPLEPDEIVTCPGR